MITAKKQSLLPGHASILATTYISYVQSAITTSKRVSVAMKFCLLKFAELEIWGLKWPQKQSLSVYNLIKLTKYSWGSMPPDPPRYYMKYVDHLDLLWPCFVHSDAFKFSNTSSQLTLIMSLFNLCCFYKIYLACSLSYRLCNKKYLARYTSGIELVSFIT